MQLILKIASRFAFGDRKNKASQDLLSDSNIAHGFFSFIAGISVVGLCLGVTALLVVTSVMNGFEAELRKALTGFHGHILLFSRAEPVRNPEKMLSEMKTDFPQILAASPYIFAEGMLSSSYGVKGGIVEGIHRPTFDSVSVIGKKLTEGRLPELSSGDPEVVLGSEVARKLHAKTGDNIVLTIPFARGGDSPLVQKLKVVGVIRLGMYEYDNKYCLLEISALQKILGLQEKVNAFKIITNDMDTSWKIAQGLNEKYIYPLRARDWSTLNKNLFYAIRHEKVVIGIILTAIILVASFNIISTLVMMIHDKKRQIAMLKALGWTPRRTLAVFLLIGGVLSILGTILGLGFGRALCGIVQWKSIIDLPSDIYFFSRLPVEIRPIEWGAIALTAVLLALFSTLWPSYNVSKQSPVEGLRYE